MAPAATTTTVTTTPATATTAASANNAEASSSRAATEPAEGFPLPSMATAENTTGVTATTTSGAASANIPLTEEEENMVERSRYWLPSGVTEEHLTELAESGFLPSKAECTWRAPGEEAEPTPQGDERVILISHLLRGMTLPPSTFFSSVLEYYGLQPHNIAPNSILVLAGFQALFEGYLVHFTL